MADISQKGSEGANDWAKKRREQIEKSKQLREERKQGGSVLKNTGEQFLFKNGVRDSQQAQNMNGMSNYQQKTQQQFTPSTLTASTTSSVGFHQYQKYHQDTQSQIGSQYGGGQSVNNFNTINSGFGVSGNIQRQNDNRQMQMDGRNQMPTRTQEGYYKQGSNQSQTIQYGNQPPQNLTSFSGFQGSSYSNNGGNDNIYNAPLRRQPSYSKQDVEVARDNLKLLKNRMNSQHRERAQSYSIAKDPQDQHETQNINAVRSNRGLSTNQFQHVPKPNRPPSGLQQQQQQQQQDSYQNQNFRRAFKPDINDGGIDRQDSSENLDKLNNLVLNGGIGQNSISLSQKNQIQQKQATEYQPERRGQPTRRIEQEKQQYNNNQVLSQDKPMKNQYDKQPQQETSRFKNEPKYKQPQYQEDEEQEEQSENFDQYEVTNGYKVKQDEEIQEDTGPDNRIECESCGRKFNEQALQKHAKICKKVFVQKRKAFDMKKQRQIEDEAAKQDEYTSNYSKPKPNARQVKKQQPPKQEDQPVGGKNAGGKAAKWKAQSEMFRAAMRASKPDDNNGKGGAGGFVAQQNTAAQYDDREECQFCGRKFNETALERHKPHCEKKHKESVMKTKGKPNATAYHGPPGMQSKIRSTSIGFNKR